MRGNMETDALRFHVSPRGDDANPGTADRPFATLVRARDTVRAAKASGAAGPVAVIIHEGTYRLEETLVLGREDGGTREAPVAWCAAPGERPVISGGVPVTDWTRHEGDILKAPGPERIAWNGRPRQLFYRGERQRRSRWPKFDPANPIAGGWAFPEGPAGDLELCAFHFREGTFPRRWRKPQQAEVKLYAGWSWCIVIIPLLGIDHERRIVRLALEPYDADTEPWYIELCFSEKNRFFVENVLEELSEPGEWCYDSDENMLYFRPPEGNFDPSAAEVPVLDCLVRIRRAEWVTLRGLTFTCTTTGDDYHPHGVQGLDAMGSQQGRRYCGEAVSLRSTRYCRIEECTFDQVGGNAVYLNRDNYRAVVSRNVIDRAGTNGVVLAGDHVFHPLFCEVTDNDIGRAGSILNYVAGVFLGLSDSCMIAHNYLHDLPHHAVNLANNGIGRNYVEHNEIRRVCLEIADTGAINSWMEVPWPRVEVGDQRAGHVIRHNLIVDVPGCTMEHGKIVPDRTTRGIYLDNCTSNCVVTDNIVVRAGMGVQFHGGKHNVVENNIVADCWLAFHGCDWPPLWPGNEHIKGMFRANRFVRNIFSSTRPDALMCWLHGWTDLTMERCDENVFHAPATAQEEFVWIERPEGRALVSRAEWQAMGFDEHSAFADPLFIDAAGGDYRLRHDSPALALGFRPIDTSEVGIRRRAAT